MVPEVKLVFHHFVKRDYITVELQIEARSQTAGV